MNPESPMAPDEHSKPEQHIEPDKYQQAWQAHTSQTRVTIDTDSLLNAVHRNQQELLAANYLDDFSTIGISLLMVPGWICLGIAMALPWTWYLMVPVLLGEVVFKLMRHMRRKQKTDNSGEPLLNGVEESLALVEYQILGQRKQFWYSLLPTAIVLLSFTAHVSWLKARDWWDAFTDVNAFVFLFLLAIFCIVHYMTQRLLHTQYEPQRQELLALLTSLKDETTNEVNSEYPILMSTKRVPCSRRRMFVGLLGVLAILLIGIPGILFSAHKLDQYFYPRKSPFAAVRWQPAPHAADQPEVKLSDEWFKLVSLDEIPADEIVAFSKQTYGDKWQKRFEEDLVELLTGMKHPPQDTVTLVVQSLTSSETRTLENVSMTRSNRRAIRNAAQARERLSNRKR